MQADAGTGTWSPSGEFTTEITVNVAPTVDNDPGEQRWTEDETGPSVDLANVFSDVETATADLTFDVSGGNHISASLTGTVLSFIFTPYSTGSSTPVELIETFTIVATDDHATVPKSVTLDIEAAVEFINHPPTIDAIGDLELLVNAGEQTVSLSGIDDGDDLKSQSISVSASSSAPAIIPDPIVTYSSGATGSIAFTPVTDASGTVTITVTVTAVGGNLSDATTSASFVVTISAITFTEVQGPLFTDTTWSLANSPYLITGPASIAVQSGATLTIQPGVEVYVNPGLALNVSGTLSAIGTAADPIRFVPANPLEPWVGIKFTDASIDASYGLGGVYESGSTLQHAIVEKAGSAGTDSTGAIESNNSFPYIAHVTITDSSANGLIVLGTAEGYTEISNLTVENSARDGLAIDNYSTSVALTSVESSGSGQYGIAATVAGLSMSTAHVHDNVYGVSLSNGSEFQIDGLVAERNGFNYIYDVSSMTNSAFRENTGDIYFFASSSTSISNVSFESNSGNINVNAYNGISVLDNLVFRDNTSSSNTIVIYGAANTTLKNSVFEYNSTTSSNHPVIRIRYVSLVEGNLFEGNTSPSQYAIGELDNVFTVQNNTFANNDILQQQPATPRFLLRIYSGHASTATITNNHFVFTKRANVFLIENGNSNTQENWDLSNNYWVTTDLGTVSTYIYGSLYDSSRSDVNFNPVLTSPPVDAPAPTQ